MRANRAKVHDKAMTAKEVVKYLRTLRYADRAWACLEQVGNATGHACKRTADLVAFGLWPSQGMEVHGIEIKVARSDWVRELQQPEKVEEGFYRYCDRWYVACPDGLIEPAEVPPSWGLLTIEGGGKVKMARDSSKLESQPWGKGQVAAVMRRMVEQMPAAAMLAAAKSEAMQEARKEAKASVDLAAERRYELLHEQHERLLKTVRDFEASSGLHLEHVWNGGRIGEAVLAVMGGSAEQMMQRSKEQATRLRDWLSTWLKDVEPKTPEVAP